jgi:hypothetical protein
MTYDDSEKALSRGAAASFKCLLCNRPMQDVGERWKCRCGFFYKPLVPGTIPHKYRQGEAKTAKKMCRECGKVEVKGMKRLCPACANSRKRASNRQAQQKRRSSVRKTGFLSIGAEALINAL